MKFQQKILNSMVVGTRQSFQILLSIFLYGILHYLISIIKL